MLISGFQKPKRLKCNSETLSDTFGEFAAQPFERGFGDTIGYAFRRVLLSSVEGAAITAVRIEGVLHEFSAIPGVVEDTTDIILNLKNIPIRSHAREPQTISLKAEGPGEVKSGDVETTHNVEIFDPDHHIASLNEEGELDIRMRVKVSRGYIPAEDNYSDDLPEEYIPIDSVHSPVEKVTYDVEDARLGRTTDYDKLTLKIWTDGSITPEDAVSHAAAIVKDHLAMFINFEEEKPKDEEIDLTEEEKRVKKYLNKSVDELDFSVRPSNCMDSTNVKTVEDLVQKTEAEMMQTPNFGKKSLQEIKNKLAEMGLELGMELDSRGIPYKEKEDEEPEEEEEKTPGEDEQLTDDEKIFRKHILKSVEELDFSGRLENCLTEANIETLEDLVQKSEEELLEISNFGSKSFEKVKDKLIEMGLEPGIELDDRGLPANREIPDKLKEKPDRGSLTETEKRIKENLLKSTEELEFSSRIKKCFSNAGIETVEDLVQKSEDELLEISNFGNKSFEKVKDKLSEMDLEPGMELDDRGLPTEEEE